MNKKQSYFLIGGIIVIILIVVLVYGNPFAVVGAGCAASSFYNDCDEIYNVWTTVKGTTPTNLYVCGWQTSTCSGNNYAVGINDDDPDCSSNKGELIKTCSKPSSGKICSNEGGQCLYLGSESCAFFGYGSPIDAFCQGTGYTCCSEAVGTQCDYPDGNENDYYCYLGYVKKCVKGNWDDYGICGAYQFIGTDTCTEDLRVVSTTTNICKKTTSTNPCTNPTAEHNKYHCTNGYIELCQNSVWKHYKDCWDYQEGYQCVYPSTYVTSNVGILCGEIQQQTTTTTTPTTPTTTPINVPTIPTTTPTTIPTVPGVTTTTTIPSGGVITPKFDFNIWFEENMWYVIGGLVIILIIVSIFMFLPKKGGGL